MPHKTRLIPGVSGPQAPKRVKGTLPSDVEVTPRGELHQLDPGGVKPSSDQGTPAPPKMQDHPDDWR